MHIFIATAATVLIGVGYSVAVLFHQPDKIWEWLNTLIGSGLSFFLAISGGLYLFRLQGAAIDRAERTKLLKLLQAEMSDLMRILSDTERMKLDLPQEGVVKEVLIAFVQPLVIERAALSGMFTETHSENLLHMARKIRMLNFKCEYLLGLVQARAEAPFLVHAADNCEQTRAAAIDGLTHVARQLGISFSDDYPD